MYVFAYTCMYIYTKVLQFKADQEKCHGAISAADVAQLYATHLKNADKADQVLSANTSATPASTTNYGTNNYGKCDNTNRQQPTTPDVDDDTNNTNNTAARCRTPSWTLPAHSATASQPGLLSINVIL
jgi:hypothetical protein